MTTEQAELQRVREYAELMHVVRKCARCGGPTAVDIFGNEFCPTCQPFQLESCGICKKPRWRCSC